LKVWLDAQVSPALAQWMSLRLGVEARAIVDLGLRNAKDHEIFFSARSAGAVVLTKDADFVELVLRHGPPPQVVWVTAGNTSNARLRTLLESTWPRITALLDAGESLVELQSQS
jgi:predicted nuclease of predicted toxin-antitoxin system